MRLLLEPSYANLEFELASALHCIISSYWRRMQACTSPSAAGFRPEVQVLYNSSNFSFVSLQHLKDFLHDCIYMLDYI